jgi:hypothetical protein
LRRAKATPIVLKRVDVKTAQARIGHSGPRLTLGIHAQATSDGDRAEAEGVADLLDLHIEPTEVGARDGRGTEAA